MGVASNATTATILPESFTRLVPTTPSPGERERVRMEFYQTYDLMTGIRIAATLGGFFALMVLLVVYKSKCKSQADESLEAAITAVVAEEEELEAVLNQGKFDYAIHGPRQSLGNMSAPAYTRFLSVGGYGSLMNPPSRRYDRGTRGRVSLPASDISFRYFNPPSSSQDRSACTWKSYDEEEENDLEEVDENDDCNETKFLQIPSTRRKISVELSPSFNFERKGSCARAEFLARMNRNAQFVQKSFNPINIKVIQPTPQISPSESSSGLQEDNHFSDHLSRTDGKLAPLASIGSCSALSSIESENRSIGSDSVFITSDNIEEDDTDKELNEEELSSAKSDQDCTNKKYRIVPTANSCFVISGNPLFNTTRRFSDSNMQIENFKNMPLPIVTNLRQENNQTVTSVCNKSSSSSSSSTSVSSNFCSSNSTNSDARKKGIFSRIAIIDTSSPKKTDKIIKIKKRLLSKSEPMTINLFKDRPAQVKNTNLKTLSLKNLVDSDLWTQETLF